METKYTHQCIKCRQSYADLEIDAYYCPSCNEVRKSIAADIDKRMVSNSSIQPKSDLANYDELRRASGGRFPNIKNLGIKL